MSTKYAHLELGTVVTAGMPGYYTPQKEVRLKHNGREVLYVVGQAAVGCGSDSWVYAVVPGYVVSWQNTENEAGLPVSEVESISDEAAQANIRRTIETDEAAFLVEFH